MIIFHLVTDAEWAAGCDGLRYTPARFAQDGFVHCSPDPQTTLAVARSYFAKATGPIWVLKVEADACGCPVRFEPPAPIAGGGGGHRTEGTLFPHVYGPIPLAAMRGKRELRREGESFVWPY